MEKTPTKNKEIELVKAFYNSLNGHDYVGFLRAKNAVLKHYKSQKKKLPSGIKAKIKLYNKLL